MTSERDVLEVFERANPVPDPDLLTVEPDAGRFLADLLDHDSIVVQQVGGQPVDHRRRWLLPAVAAAVAVIVVVGLVAFSAGDADAPAPADTTPPTPPDTTPPTPPPATTTPSARTTTAAVTVEDRLSGLILGEDFVAPGALPESYEVLAAVSGGVRPGRFGTAVVIGGDTVPEVTFRNGQPPTLSVADTIEIDGVEWTISERGDVAPVVLQRRIPNGYIVIESYASRDLTIELARLAEPASPDQLGIDVIDLYSAGRVVAAIDDVRLNVIGAGGFYCGVLDGGTIGSAQGNCLRVEPDAPVATFAWLRGTETVYTAGVADADVASIEFFDADDQELGVVDPAVGPSEFAEQFWITDAFDPTEAERAVVVRDDGTRTELTQGIRRVGIWQDAPTPSGPPISGPQATRPTLEMPHGCLHDAAVSDLVGVWVAQNSSGVDNSDVTILCEWVGSSSDRTDALGTVLHVYIAHGRYARDGWELSRASLDRQVARREGILLLDPDQPAFLMAVAGVSNQISDIEPLSKDSLQLSASVLDDDVLCIVELVTPTEGGKFDLTETDDMFDLVEGICTYRFHTDDTIASEDE